MGQLINIGIEDIIKHQRSAPNFNNEVLVIDLNGEVDIERNERVQIDGFTLILMLEGTLDININGNDNHISSKAFLDVLDIHAIQNVKRSADFRGYHIIVKHRFMDEAMRGIKRLPVCNFITRFAYPIMLLDDQEAMLLEQRLMDIVKNIGRTDHTYRRDLVKNELRSLLIEVSNLIVIKGKKQEPGLFKSKNDIVAQFIIMVNKHCAAEHSVNFYAQELCIEPKYLSRILKELNGKTANRWIDDAIIMKARMMLKDPDLTIQQVADLLNFSDQSAFGKFFKKHCEISPLNYRRE